MTYALVVSGAEAMDMGPGRLVWGSASGGGPLGLRGSSWGTRDRKLASHGRASLPASQHRQGWTMSMAERLLEASPDDQKRDLDPLRDASGCSNAVYPPNPRIPHWGRVSDLGLGGVARWGWRGRMETGVASLGTGGVRRCRALSPTTDGLGQIEDVSRQSQREVYDI